MNQQTLSPKKIEQAAREMRDFVKSAQRKLLEFEVMMSTNEIKKGKFETFNTADELLKSVS